jgi:hypothetical protein
MDLATLTERRYSSDGLLPIANTVKTATFSESQTPEDFSRSCLLAGENYFSAHAQIFQRRRGILLQPGEALKPPSIP